MNKVQQIQNALIMSMIMQNMNIQVMEQGIQRIMDMNVYMLTVFGIEYKQRVAVYQGIINSTINVEYPLKLMNLNNQFIQQQEVQSINQSRGMSMKQFVNDQNQQEMDITFFNSMITINLALLKQIQSFFQDDFQKKEPSQQKLKIQQNKQVFQFRDALMIFAGQVDQNRLMVQFDASLHNLDQVPFKNSQLFNENNERFIKENFKYIQQLTLDIKYLEIFKSNQQNLINFNDSNKKKFIQSKNIQVIEENFEPLSKRRKIHLGDILINISRDDIDFLDEVKQIQLDQNSDDSINLMYQSLSLEVKIYLNEEKEFRLGLGQGYKIITDLYENYTISQIYMKIITYN